MMLMFKKEIFYADIIINVSIPSLNFHARQDESKIHGESIYSVKISK